MNIDEQVPPQAGDPDCRQEMIDGRGCEDGQSDRRKPRARLGRNPAQRAVELDRLEKAQSMLEKVVPASRGARGGADLPLPRADHRDSQRGSAASSWSRIAGAGCAVVWSTHSADGPLDAMSGGHEIGRDSAEFVARPHKKGGRPAFRARMVQMRSVERPEIIRRRVTNSAPRSTAISAARAALVATVGTNVRMMQSRPTGRWARTPWRRRLRRRQRGSRRFDCRLPAWAPARSRPTGNMFPWRASETRTYWLPQIAGKFAQTGRCRTCQNCFVL